jgi:phosphatidylserine/phosphatidylglycerophosphate/cardiolipin synthase-like enzyme
MSEHLSTQNPVKVFVDEERRTATSSAQFFLELDPRVKKYYGNALDFIICGEEGFRSIAKELAGAQQSADIICWGFDPGMELERSTDTLELSGNTWPRGLTYGALLEQLAGRGVKVRLLIWSNVAGSVFQNNMPGYSDAQRGPLATPYISDARQKYCIDWWKRNLPYGSGSGRNQNLQVVLRDVSMTDVMHGLSDEEDRPSLTEYAAQVGFGTHHQKPVLIDYAYAEGSKAVGYVMGLNSVTDFWDRTAHEIDDPLRERWSRDSVKKEIAHETATEKMLSIASYEHSKPYQDYACRIVGPALERLHQNFVSAWNKDAPSIWKMDQHVLPPKIPKLSEDPNQVVQIVRTQAHEKEKTIKTLYFQATSWARNYIYIENQYFFYPEFARHLKKERENFCDAWCRKSGKPVSEIPKLHLFIVIPHPENDGMVPRTADTLTELGLGGAMSEQGDLVKPGDINQNYPDSRNFTYSIPVPDPYGGSQSVTINRKVLDRPGVQQLQQTLGMEVSVARLRTSGLDVARRMAYREIYIHSKLMLIDDVFVTVGSANLNQRSMAVDSEINIAASGLDKVSTLRRQIFELHSGSTISGSGEPGKLPAEFRRWNDLMVTNQDQRKAGKSLTGFLLRFEDHRSTTTMVATADIPFNDAIG